MGTRGSSRITVFLLAGIVFCGLGASCRHPDVFVPKTKLPGVHDATPSNELQQVPDEPYRDPLETLWVGLDNAVRSQVADDASIGCLPFVSYDPQHDKGWVSELGVKVADELATRIRRQRLSVAGATEMGLMIRDVNSTRATLSDTTRILENGDRLGVDVLVYGITNTRDLSRFEGPGAPRILEVKGTAVDVIAGKVLAEQTVEISNKYMENKRYWQWAQSGSDWQADGRFGPAEPQPSFDKEVEVACRILGRRVLPQLQGRNIRGAVYLPPTDTGVFVRSVARLRAAQRSYASEVQRRVEAAKQAGTLTPIDTGSPMTLDGVDFANLQAAEEYLNRLRESLFLESAGGRFARSVTNMLAGHLQPGLAQKGVDVRVNDVGFTRQSNSVHTVEGELPTGGLIRNLAARDALRQEGIEIVVAPRVERYAKHFVLRVEIYDIENQDIIGGSHFRIEDRFSEAMRVALGAGEYKLERITDIEATLNSSWSDVFERVNSGVVRIEGNQGFGSGFVVSPRGHVVTNAHVIDGIGGNAVVVMRDGTRQPFRVITNDGYQDVAIIKVDRVPSGTHVFQFARAERAKVGTDVAVLGHPKSTQGWVFTKGNLSSLNEKVKTAGGVRPSYMYTSPTRGGSSGSPVMLLDGSVVSVHSAGQVGFLEGGVRGTELVGFALGVPGPEAKKLVEEAIQ